jgi:hypothetical protein
VNGDGSAAVGLAFKDCTHVYAFKWTAKKGMRLLVITDAQALARTISL